MISVTKPIYIDITEFSALPLPLTHYGLWKEDVKEKYT